MQFASLKNLIFNSFFVFCCTTSETHRDFEVSVYPEADEIFQPVKPSVSLQILRSQFESKAINEEWMKDARLILEAMTESSKFDGSGVQAEDKWKLALKHSEGNLGKVAMEGWVSSRLKGSSQKPSLETFTNGLLESVEQFAGSSYVKLKGFDSKAKLKQYLQKNFEDAFLSEDIQSVNEQKQQDSRTFRDTVNEDYFLEEASEDYCQNPSGWSDWKRQVPQQLRNYWNGLVAQCLGNINSAVDLYKKAFNTLSVSKDYRGYAVIAARRLLLILRRSVSRPQAAEWYKKYMAFWKNSGLTSRDLNQKDWEFLAGRIDDTLWASRYVALVGDLKTAGVYANDALRMLEDSAHKVKKNRRSREAFTELTAEARHILAFRIALENGDFAEAYKQANEGIKIKKLDVDWKERMLWYSGFYLYLDGNYKKASSYWEKLLEQLEGRSFRDQVLYWLAMASRRLGSEELTEQYLEEIIREFPYSYYTLVAVPDSFPEKGLEHLNSLVANDNLYEKLQTNEHIDLSSISRKNKLWRDFYRVESFIKIKRYDWAKAELINLEWRLRRKYRLRKHPDIYVYTTRLYHMAGDHLRAIQLTTQLIGVVERFWKRWPEQLFIYFPRPYRSAYQSTIEGSNLELSIMYAISRQESGFNYLAESPANAYGLMQLIIPTANRYAKGIFQGESPKEGLLNPKINMTLGKRYLEELKAYYQGHIPAVYAAYNAGEAAVDAWATRRKQATVALWVEAIPFAETRSYVKNVWRNDVVYKRLLSKGGNLSSDDTSKFLDKWRRDASR